MKPFSIGLFALVCASVIGCQSKPFGFFNRSAATAPLEEAAIEDAGEASARTVVDETRPKPRRDSRDRGQAQVQPIPESSELIDNPRRNEPNQLERMRTQAEAALQRGDLPKATAFFREVVELDPNDAVAHHRLALIATGQQNPMLAEKHYLKAVNLDPNNPDVLNDLGYAYLEQGRFSESEGIFQLLLQSSPRNSLALRNMGELRARQGRKAEAFDYLRQGGLDRQAAERHVIATAGSGPDTIVGDRGVLTESGLADRSPTPEGDSRYGVAPVADQRALGGSPAQSGMLLTPENSGVSAFRQTPGGTPFPPVAQQRVATGASDDAYALERALLNAGPGSLFPVTPPPEQNNLAGTPGDARTIAPVNYEAVAPVGGMNTYTTTANPSGAVQIQSPTGDTHSQPASPHAIPLSSGLQTSSGAFGNDIGYQQFPSRSSETDRGVDPLRQYEAEIQDDSYRSGLRYP